MLTKDDIFNAKILIVDDLEANVILLERTLAAAGYLSISSTMNPCEVCTLHRANRYDLIVLDIQMPGMDGFAVMEGLKEVGVEDYLSVLAVTVNPNHKRRALLAGAKDFISKPLDLVEVRARVYNMLEVRLLLNDARKQAKTLETLALHDPLTGLANRRLFEEKAALALASARRDKCGMAVAYIDLDDFKLINDTWGHDAGDALLVGVAERLVAAVREEDTVARLGGDEFLIALWKLGDAEVAGTVGLKLTAAMAEPFVIQGHSLSVTASIGFAIYPAHGDDVETLMKRADSALYDVKRQGKDAFRITEQIEESTTT